jgi:hypothetical protein
MPTMVSVCGAPAPVGSRNGHQLPQAEPLEIELEVRIIRWSAPLANVRGHPPRYHIHPAHRDAIAVSEDRRRAVHRRLGWPGVLGQGKAEELGVLRSHSPHIDEHPAVAGDLAISPRVQLVVGVTEIARK